MSSPPAFSRNGTTSPLGKLDAELPKQRISGVTLGALQRLASESEMTLAEFIRMVLDARAHGVDAIKKMHGDRIEQVVGIGEGKG